MDRFRSSCVIIFCVFLFSGYLSSEPRPCQALFDFCRVFSGVQKVGVIYSDASVEDDLKALEAQARELKLDVIKVRVSSIKDVPQSARNLIGLIDTLFIVDDPLINIPDAFNYIMLTAMQNRCKTIVPRRELLAKGGLFHSGEDGEIFVNQRIMKFMKLSPREGAPEIKYYGESK